MILSGVLYLLMIVFVKIVFADGLKIDRVFPW
jgi:hypothetical protein